MTFGTSVPIFQQILNFSLSTLQAFKKCGLMGFRDLFYLQSYMNGNLIEVCLLDHMGGFYEKLIVGPAAIIISSFYICELRSESPAWKFNNN